MYPTGGYGHFLYYLLSEHLASTVKLSNKSWSIENGNCHKYFKYTESFLLGPSTHLGTLSNFSYHYNILDKTAAIQIGQGKDFVVLADVGNKGDNVKFLRRYFPYAKIIRVVAKNFVEKLILWTNCMIKSNDSIRNELYPGSILPISGIAAWANKSVENVTDNDAINCMINFFQSDFGIYGKMFCNDEPDAINISISNFFTKQNILVAIEDLANKLNTQCVDRSLLEKFIPVFLEQQASLSLIHTGDSFPLVRKALFEYDHIHHLAT